MYLGAGLRVRPTHIPMAQSFSPSRSEQNALGVYALVGSHYSAIPPADHPVSEAEVREIIRLLGPNYRPLWLTNIWRSPNGGLVRRCHHVMGHYDPEPKRRRRLLTGLVLPSTKLYGIEWRNPIFQDELLDGLTNDERAIVGRTTKREDVPGKRRILPRYEPIDARIIRGLRYSQWADSHLTPDQQAREPIQEQKQATDKATKELSDQTAYKIHNDRVYDGQRDGTIGRVFVSEKLTKLREAAGAAA